MGLQSSYFLILSVTFRPPAAVFFQKYRNTIQNVIEKQDNTGQKLPKYSKKLRNTGQKTIISLLPKK